MEVNTAEWIQRQTKRLDSQPITGYLPSGPPSAESVAFAALAACAYQRPGAAATACRRLFESQLANGSVAVWLDDNGPYWPTSLACIAWRRFEKLWPEQAKSWCRDGYEKGMDFLLNCGGEKIAHNDIIGHDTELVGWPWVLGTHSWIEPTAMALLAMRHCDRANHPRAIEATKLLLDRQLPTGGANYGNTFVLGQVLRPHVLPSAMCVVALHRITPVPKELGATVHYLQQELNRPIAATSLSWTIHALVSAAWNSENGFELEFDWPLRSAIERLQVMGENPHRQNQLMLAARYRQSPLLDLPSLQTGKSNRGTLQ
ncbi:hypothetical protein RMSM_01038 [Rhodopirellula maiorica SM1]|uniref:Squalene cyclase C-terminal domain-containing protein n=1 Tax=Rhodopirellula maiorica SM1 TaxID=1265738 RepID=M5RRW2_9BACT|nr:hypothetical protein [Rhodopirellula maiorica]EMI22030.1 hypothetical protein RMSM_01038 [Rhodopirellula maiorica SM1]